MAKGFRAFRAVGFQVSGLRAVGFRVDYVLIRVGSKLRATARPCLKALRFCIVLK